MGLSYGTSLENNAPAWLLIKFQHEESSLLVAIAKTLWAIWFFHNKKVWENKDVTSDISMEWSLKIVSDWREAKIKRATLMQTKPNSVVHLPVRWKKPEVGTSKLSVDVAYHPGVASFSLGLILRDHAGDFVACKTLCKPMVSMVVEAEAMAILECLHWLISMTHVTECLLNQILYSTSELYSVHRITFYKLVIFWMLGVVLSILDQVIRFLLIIDKRIGLLI